MTPEEIKPYLYRDKQGSAGAHQHCICVPATRCRAPCVAACSAVRSELEKDDGVKVTYPDL